MRKTKVIYALIASAMLSLAVTGCGSNETIDNDMSVESTTPAPTDAVDLGGVVDSDDVTPTTEPTATSTPEPTATSTPVPSEAPTEAPTEVVEPTTTPESTEAPTEAPTPEPTATPEPTEAPKMTDWLEENGYEVSEAGDFTYTGWAYEYFADGSKTTKCFEITGNCEYSEVDNGDGTKTITAKIAQNPCTTEAGSWCPVKGLSFVADRYTGTVYTVSDFNLTESFVVTLEDGRKVTIIVYQEKINATKYSDEQTVETFTVTVPADYDGLVCGWAPTKGFEAYGKTVTFADFPIFDGAEIFMWAE